MKTTAGFLCPATDAPLHPVHGRSTAPGFRRVRRLCAACIAAYCDEQVEVNGRLYWQIRAGDDPGEGPPGGEQLSLELGEE